MKTQPDQRTQKSKGTQCKGKKGSTLKTTRPKARRPDSISHAWLKEVWPQERDLLYRPERLKYVRRVVESRECVFCISAETPPGLPNLLLHRDQSAMVILNKFPYNTGHLLVLPARHCGDPVDLPEEEYLQVQKLVRYALYVVREVYGADGANVGLNLGRVAGAGIPEHLHYHIIPRWSGDTNFFPLIAETKVLVETLEQSYERLLPYFKKGTPGLP